MQKWDLPEPRRPYDDFLDGDSDEENDEADDSAEDEDEVDNGEVTLTIALQVGTLSLCPCSLIDSQVIDRFGGKQSNPNLPMDDLMKTVFRDAIDYIGRFISERGMQGECLFAKQEGYEILFGPMNKHLITDFKVCALLSCLLCSPLDSSPQLSQIFDSWITTVTSIGLARIESKMVCCDFRFLPLAMICQLTILSLSPSDSVRAWCL
jgi:hypothetical protein